MVSRNCRAGLNRCFKQNPMTLAGLGEAGKVAFMDDPEHRFSASIQGVLRSLLLSFLMLGLAWSSWVAAGSMQPAVAIKQPKVGDKVSKYARKHLNIELLWAEMESSFRASRKFRVLSRNSDVMAELREEQKFAESDLAKGDAAATGAMSNAHYLLLPKVQNFKFYRSVKKLPNFDDKYRRQDSGLLHITAQMVDTTSGQVVSTFDLQDRFGTKAEIVNTKRGAPNNLHFTNMAKTVSAQLADQFVDAVYPMKVVKRTRRNQIVINRGKDGGLKKGQKYEVFFAGEALVDPDTGESLGSGEEYVGQIEIIRINPKVSYAKILSELDPESGPIGVGDIVRKPQ